MKKLVIFIVLAISAEISAQVKELPIKTSVDGVTIFMNGAQVFRSKTIDITQGSNVLKFTGLSPYVDPKSVQVKVKGGVMVMSVNHQFNYTDSIARSKELDELSSKLRSVDSKIQLESVNSEIINDELEFLKENRNVGAKGQVVTLAGLKEVATYYSERVTALKMKQIDISKRIETLSLERNALQNQINQVSGKKSDPMSEVVVKMNAPAQTKCEVELSYYVNNAGWFPTYDIRSKSTNDPIEIMYKANIHQNTKEEWNNVKIKLSSSNPKTGGVAPQLKPYLVDYYLVPPRYENLFSILSGKIIASDDNSPIPGATISVKNSTIKTMSDANGNYSISIPSVGSEIEVSFVGFDPKTIRATTPNIDIVLTPSTLMLQEIVVASYSKQDDISSQLGGKAAGITIRGNSTLTAKNKALAEPLQIPVNIQEAQTSVEFEIKTPYTITSDNRSIAVDIDKLSYKADYEYLSVPKLDKDVFLLAKISDFDKSGLLAGEANVFFENTYVGKTILDLANSSDTLQLSLGRDNNISVKRESISNKRSSQFFGSKKEDARNWMIKVQNNRSNLVNLKIIDQIPVSQNSEIDVAIENISEGILNKNSGEISWNLKLSPNDKKEIEIKYKVRYPKDKSLIIE